MGEPGRSQALMPEPFRGEGDPVSAMRLVLLGDGDSPHLEKWVHGLLQVPSVELWLASSRGFTAGIVALLPAQRRLALHTQPRSGGGNVGVLLALPRLVRWLRPIRPHWLHAHYLTSHGSLGWLAQRLGGVSGRMVGSAWGSDILVSPQRSALLRGLTRRVLQHCALTTSDSQVMASQMRALGAGEVMVFPFGLESMPAVAASPQALQKDPQLFFANRGLEPIYAPHRVLQLFADIKRFMPSARLVVAHDGSLRGALQAQAAQLGISHCVQFTGRLSAADQAKFYQQSQWYLSLPNSDSVAVSVLEAMAHGCVPLLSDLPANRELVSSGVNGWLLADGASVAENTLQALQSRAGTIAADNRAWIEQHALFGPCVQRFVQRLEELHPL